MGLPEVVSQEEWLVARKELLAKEKAATAARDALNADRRRLPMVRVVKDYVFQGAAGEVRLADLFEGRRQLIVHHFMWPWTTDSEGREVPAETGCPSCSATADNIGDLTHLKVRDTTLAAVSRGPLDKMLAFRERMGWRFPWYSSLGSDFNYDFHATVDDRVSPVLLNYRTPEELAEVGLTWSPARRGDYPGLSCFLRDGSDIFHTYSTYARGLEQPGGTHAYLDLTALGRQEPWEEPKHRATSTTTGAGNPALRYHDEYDV